jgi:hypothetical protein
MFNLSRLLNRKPSRAGTPPRTEFARMLSWKILRGSHEFPGPDGGTCVNEAAIIAAGYPYQAVRRIDDCPSSFSRPLALYAMCLNEIVPSDALRQELLMPFVTRLAGSADSRDVEMLRVALILRRTISEILPEALDAAGYAVEVAQCRAVRTIGEAVAVVRELPDHAWHRHGTLLIGLINSLSMAAGDYLAGRAVDAVQYAGTAIADVAEVVSSFGGERPVRAAPDIYRRGAAILDEAFRIGNRAGELAPDIVVSRMENAKRFAAGVMSRQLNVA